MPIPFYCQAKGRDQPLLTLLNALIYYYYEIFLSDPHFLVRYKKKLKTITLASPLQFEL